MDFSLITAAASAIASARELGRAALGVRDFNQVAAAMSQINEQLLKAQDSLFAHNTQLAELQSQHFEATQQLREMREALRERGRYSLFEITVGNFVYRMNPAPQGSDVVGELASEPMHYICHGCSEKGVKSVLGLVSVGALRKQYICHACGRKIQC